MPQSRPTVNNQCSGITAARAIQTEFNAGGMMDGTMKDTTTRAVMLAAVVLLPFAAAAQAQAQPQRSTGRRAALAAEQKRMSDDARMRGSSLGAYTVAAP